LLKLCDRSSLLSVVSHSLSAYITTLEPVPLQRSVEYHYQICLNNICNFRLKKGSFSDFLALHLVILVQKGNSMSILNFFLFSLVRHKKLSTCVLTISKFDTKLKSSKFLYRISIQYNKIKFSISKLDTIQLPISNVDTIIKKDEGRVRWGVGLVEREKF
jgi:hypothetical protein